MQRSSFHSKFSTRYDHKDIIAGQGTVGIEMLEKVPDLDYVIVPVGGGGLVAGICKAVKKINPTTKIIVSRIKAPII